MLSTGLFIVSTLAFIDLNIFWVQPESMYRSRDIVVTSNETRSETNLYDYLIFDSLVRSSSSSSSSKDGEDFLVVLAGVLFCTLSVLLLYPLHSFIYMKDPIIFRDLACVQAIVLVLLLFREYRHRWCLMDSRSLYAAFLFLSLMCQLFVAIQLYHILYVTLGVIMVSSFMVAINEL